MECFSQSLVCNAGETIPREIEGLRILERLVRTVLTGHLGLPGVPNAAKHEKGRKRIRFRPAVSWSRGQDLNLRPSGYEEGRGRFAGASGLQAPKSRPGKIALFSGKGGCDSVFIRSHTEVPQGVQGARVKKTSGPGIIRAHLFALGQIAKS